MSPSITSSSSRESRMHWVRAAWVLLAMLYIGVFFAALPIGYEIYQATCSADSCPRLQLTEAEVVALQDLGFSPRFYAGFLTAGELVLLFWALLGIFIFVRRSQDWIGILVSMSLIGTGVNGLSENAVLLAERTTDLAPLHNALSAISAALMISLVFLFPDGRFTPSWSRYIAIPLVVTALIDPFLVSVFPPMEAAPGTLALLITVLIGAVAGVVAQTQRYRHHSNLEQRQQTKWVVVGFLGLMLTALIWALSNVVAPPSPGLGRLRFFLIGLPTLNLLLLILPTTMTVSILRYRLFDIDVIIHRALVYSLLTGILIATFFAVVTILEGVFRTLTGEGSELSVVISTLAIAWLANPLRLRVQETIDRRFYRQKYDAAQTLANFARTVRDEVDLDRMEAALITAVDETMQPEHVSLWLTGSFVSKRPSQART